MSNVEGFQPRELFVGLSKEKKQILANNISVIETTYGDEMACKMCCLNTPIGLHAIMPSPTIQAIHQFIREYSNNQEYSQYLHYHHRGQVTDYFDPATGWDMADIVIGGLTTGRTILLYMHGIDPNDKRAKNAFERLKQLPQEQKERIEIVISTDPFGPCNVPDEVAEEIGRERAYTALQASYNMPHIMLRIHYLNELDKERQIQKAKAHFGNFMPAKYQAWKITTPTRTDIGADKGTMFDLGNGYNVLYDETVEQKPHGTISSWEKIGTLSHIDESKFIIPSNIWF